MDRRFSGPRFGGERRYFEEDFEKPVKVGETYDVEIKELGSKGDGIARVKNFIIFVSGTKEGEKCKIKITQVARKFAIAEKVSEVEKTKKTKKIPEEVEGEEVEDKVSEVEKTKKIEKTKKTKKIPEEVEGEEVEDK